ncbi:MAG: type I methionyl aminopeptidase [Patescibacteria group bacterium]
MIIIKTQSEIEIMRQGGKILAQIVKEVGEAAKPGVSTEELNYLAEKLMRKYKAEPSFKNYRGYPKSICTSVNDVIVHGIPSAEAVLKNGDILGLDIGLKYKELYTDMAVTIPIGRISKAARRLINVTKKSLELALKKVRAGQALGDICYAVQNYAEANGFDVIRDLVGHGVGKQVHEDPKIPNYGEPGSGVILAEGMTLAIEPMVVAGYPEISVDDDGWTARTKDGELAAHFEVTLAVTRDGLQILTK